MKHEILTLIIGWFLFSLCLAGFLFCVWCVYQGHGSKTVMVINSLIFGVNTLFMVKFKFWRAF